MFRGLMLFLLLSTLACAIFPSADAQSAPQSPSSPVSDLPWMQPYKGPRRQDIDAGTLVGKVLCGYQGWFRAPGDPTGGGWFHWSRDGRRMTPDTLNVEMWPDMTAYSPEEQYPAGEFSYPDGKPATLFSSANPKTVARHFDWMQQYGIDGVLVQRFLGGLDGASGSAREARVLGYARYAANRTGRVFAVEYDMTGTPPDKALDIMQKDWKFLVDVMKITDDPRYLKQNGRPVVAVFGFFKDRFSGEWANKIVDAFHSRDRYGVFLIGGCQWWWRDEKDAEWAKAFRRFDAIKPWNVGNWGTYDGVPGARTDYWTDDLAEAKRAGMLYLPVLYPGFSWNNLQRKPADTPGIPRLGGDFFRKQFQTVTKAGISQAFVAMFDEVDEGTAIFKVTNTPPAQGHFVTFEGKPSDFYLRLTGDGTRLLHEAVKRANAQGRKTDKMKHFTPPEQDFFAKELDYEGIPIKAPEVVDDTALFVARDRLARLLRHLPDALYNLRQAGAELHIIGRNQVTSDLPEHRHLKGKPFDGKLTVDERTRGLGGLLTSCGEENLLELPNDRYKGRDICTHEFAHNLQDNGLSEDVRQKIRDQYHRSLDKGLWKGAYAAKNESEFFAELTMWYFGTHGDLNMTGVKPANGPEGLKAYDPDAYALLDDLYSGRIPVTRKKNP